VDRRTKTFRYYDGNRKTEVS